MTVKRILAVFDDQRSLLEEVVGLLDVRRSGLVYWRGCRSWYRGVEEVEIMARRVRTEEQKVEVEELLSGERRVEVGGCLSGKN